MSQACRRANRWELAIGGNMIRGVLLPIITPFDEKIRVDEQVMRQLVDFHISAGVQGLFVLGSTGQGPAMTIEERKQAAAITLAQARSRVPVIIHVGTADAGSTVELAEHAAAHKADAVGIVPPYYYSDHTEYEILDRKSTRLNSSHLGISY